VGRREKCGDSLKGMVKRFFWSNTYQNKTSGNKDDAGKVQYCVSMMLTETCVVGRLREQRLVVLVHARVSDPYPRVHGQPYKATTEVDTGEHVAISGITQVLLLAGSYFTPNNREGRFWLSMRQARRHSTASYQNRHGFVRITADFGLEGREIGIAVQPKDE